VQASLDQKQRLRQLFFPDGIAFDGNRFNRTGATAPFFKYLAPEESVEEKVSRRGIEPTARPMLPIIGLLPSSRLVETDEGVLGRTPDRRQAGVIAVSVQSVVV
jgi:hypothetical protein